MNTPVISIIVPVYKVEKYLRRCLDSIKMQNFIDWECILIDDGSPDKSGDICDEYAANDARFKVFHQVNAGVSAARNKGLDESKGEWIGFVDSDDWIMQEMYDFLYKKAKNENADVVCCGINLLFNQKYKKVSFRDKEDVFYKFLHYKVYMHSPCNKLIRRGKIGNKRFDTTMKTSEDLLFIFDILTDKNVKIKYYDTQSYYVYVQENENSSKNLVLSESKFYSKQQLKKYINRLYSERELDGKNAKKYLDYINFNAVLPYIDTIEFFNPQIFRDIYGPWRFAGCSSKLFFQVFFVYLKLDRLVKTLIQLKLFIKKIS